jgi:CheY-like chemotaxis protein
VKERITIIESVTRHLGSKGFDVTPTLEIADEADGTKPLIYYLISHLTDLPKPTATVSQKINNIIIFSGYSDTEKIEKAFKAGADLYIAKPVDISTIKQIIEDAANTSEFPSNFIKEIYQVHAPD